MNYTLEQIDEMRKLVSMKQSLERSLPESHLSLQLIEETLNTYLRCGVSVEELADKVAELESVAALCQQGNNHAALNEANARLAQ